jgi:alkylated DNA repair dioxygenase AlkB
VRTEFYELPDRALCELVHGFVPAAETRALFAALCAELPLSQHTIRVYGRDVQEPRLVAYVGDPDASYTYSGKLNVPSGWTPALSALRERVMEQVALPFNAVLCNLYRSGRDSMGMHNDAEPELGEHPLIASLSLGAERKFVIRHRRGHARGSLDLMLPSGSLLVMRGEMQAHYRHGLPKQLKLEEPRLNLTFRLVRPVQERLRSASRSMP